MFRGRFEHSLDEKGRLAVPSKFRDLITDSSDSQTIMITNLDFCIAAYSMPEWEKLEQKIARLTPFDPKVMAFQRFFISGATDCVIDKAGRILIPATLREYAGITRDCVVIGQLTRFEIWSAEKWLQKFNELADFSTLANTMSELGLQL